MKTNPVNIFVIVKALATTMSEIKHLCTYLLKKSMELVMRVTSSEFAINQYHLRTRKDGEVNYTEIGNAMLS